MKIDSSNPKRTGSVVSNEECNQEAASANSSTPSRANNVVHVNARPILSPTQEADREVVVDRAKVAEVKQAISEGRFEINPDVVADRLLETVKELVLAKKNKT